MHFKDLHHLASAALTCPRVLYNKALKLFLLFLGSIISITASAQTEEVNRIASYMNKHLVIPPAPEAAQLGKYGDVPVSLYTGAVQIGIPLYELKGKYLSLPIALSYNSSGIIVAEDPSWVGSGWSLSAGGVITRAVQGNPDNDFNYYSKSAEISSLVTTVGLNNRLAWYQLYQNIEDGYVEPQPDIYYYNFAGKSGKFSISPSKEVYFYDGVNFKVEWVDELSFTITDDLGVIYEFNARESTAYVLSDDVISSAIKNYDFVSSWYLTKITSPIGNEVIEFQYQGESNYYYPPVTAGHNSARTHKKTTYEASLIPTPPQITSYVSAPNATYISMRRIFLTNVTHKLAGQIIDYVQFNSTTSGAGRKLDEIIIQKGGFTKGYNLGFDNSTNRLTLKTLREKGDGEVLNEPYAFEYQGVLPNVTSPQIDHWGYYNSNPSSSLIPGVMTGGCNGIYFEGLGADRSPSSNCMAGSLSKIIYPTKGYTNFTFEPHFAAASAENCNSNDRMVGGLRIKEIKNYDHTNALISFKSYSYELENVVAGHYSSGLLFTEPQYYMQSSYHHANPTDPYWDPYLDILTTISAMSRGELGTSQGSHIGYSRVEEIEVGSIGNGKTVYYYNNSPSITHEDGDLLKTEQYDATGRLLSKLENEYGVIKASTYFNGTKLLPDNVQNNNTYLCIQSAGYDTWLTQWDLSSTSCVQLAEFKTKYNMQQYSLWQHWKHLTKSTNTVYTYISNVPIATTVQTDYEYSNPNTMEPTAKVISTSTSQNNRFETKYAHDVNNTSFIDAHIYSMPIVEKEYKGLELIGGNRTVYSSLLPSQFYKILTDGTEVLWEQIEDIDAFTGNVRQYSRDHGIKTAVFWGNNFQYPVAKVIGMDYNAAKIHITQSVLDNPMTTDQQMRDELNKLRANLTGVQVITFTYNILGKMTSQTDARGVITYYKYDNFQRLETIKDQNGHVIKSYDYHYKTN